MSENEKPNDSESTLPEDAQSKAGRTGADRRSINFYQHYSDEELKDMPKDRRKGDRRTPEMDDSENEEDESKDD